MASIFEKIYLGNETKRGTAESTLMLATLNAAHFFNVQADVELDNGNVIAYVDPTQWIGNDYFKAVAPKATDEICLHLTAPKLYEEYAQHFQHEDNFFLGVGETGRAYEVTKGDRFAVSELCFDEAADLDAHKYVVISTAEPFKLTTVEANPSETNAFVGYILHDTAAGDKKVVFVMKNRA